MNVSLTLPPEVLDEVVERVAAIVLERIQVKPQPESPYMTVEEAAVYLRAKRQRVYDLLSARRLTRFKDGSRVLIAKAELDALLAGGLSTRSSGVAHPLPMGARSRTVRRPAA